MPPRTRANPIIILLSCLVVTTTACTAAHQQVSNERSATALKKGATHQHRQPLHAAARGTIADVAAGAVVSVVNIASVRVTKGAQQRGFGPFHNDPFFRRFFRERTPPQRGPQERRQRSLGSGVIVDAQGTVLTNNHVIAHTEDITVTLSDGRVFEATVIGTDPQSDLGVLRLKGDVKGLTPIAYGDSDSLRLGDVVLAIGNPFGVGQTVTMGIVSAKGRADVGIVDYEDFIQTDAAINPGNSGGALVDMQGRLVGINTAILSRSGGYQGIGFAIPSNMVRPVAESLVRHGKVVRGWLGVVIQAIDEDLAEALGLKDTRGVLIGDVNPDSPAAKGGLERGDVVISVNGQATATIGKFRNSIASAGAGSTVSLEVWRDKAARSLSITLGEKRDKAAQAQELTRDKGALQGLTLSTLDKALSRELRLPPQLSSGVVVTKVKRGSPAARVGFRPGDVIRAINRQPMRSVKAVLRAYEQATGTIAVLVQRGTNTLFVALRKP